LARVVITVSVLSAFATIFIALGFTLRLLLVAFMGVLPAIFLQGPAGWLRKTPPLPPPRRRRRHNPPEITPPPVAISARLAFRKFRNYYKGGVGEEDKEMAKEYKELNCRDTGADCDFRVRAETEEELLDHCSTHACQYHGACKFSPDDEKMIKSFIKTVTV
jgi:predicted small metal-binding protein